MHAILIALLILPALAKTPTRPMDEMEGDCANYKMNVARELALWSNAGVKVKAGALLPVEQKLEVALTEQDKNGSTARFALKVPVSGKYRVSAGSRVWIDLLEGEKIVEPGNFEMQTKCDKVIKAIEFVLDSKSKYWVKIGKGQNPSAHIAVTKVN